MTQRVFAAQADVATDAPARYAKQLVSHLGRKLSTQTTGGGRHRIAFDDGECVLVEGEGSLRLEATASDPDALRRVQDVVGSHLERFGERSGLAVVWGPQSSG